MSNLIDPLELYARLGEASLRVVDARFDLADSEAGEREYLQAHIPGAVYAHLDRDLSGPLARHGGRHPLPDGPDFIAWLERVGIGNEHDVVVYDSASGMFAARLWWLLKYYGHDAVRVLDGGLAAWRAAGLPVAAEPGSYPSARFQGRRREEMAVDRDRVLRAIEDPDVLLVDARASERYRGEVEPIDPRAGHIPTAINLPFVGNLDGGRFREAEALRERYQQAAEAEEVVVYCGSGVSAAHDLLAMEEAGILGARLYHGSWSDWCSFEDAPIAREDES